MRSGAERLRAGLLVGAVAVLAIVVAFLVVARWRAHRLLHDLPERLGAEIQKETNGFTYSQSLGGRTVFTIHAARAIQRKDGQAVLHDAGIVLYGKGGRADRIHGKDFDYNQAAGVVRAEGEVELDLQAPAPVSARERAAFAAGQTAGQRVEEDGPSIHAVTSGLVYMQQLGVASTEAPIRFAVKGLTGQAVGASFATDTGKMVLERDVRLSTISEGRPALLTAAHAELDRTQHVMEMNGARYVTFAGGRAGDERVLQAGHLLLHLREDGSVESADGEGGVQMKSGNTEVRAPKGTMLVSKDGRPRDVRLVGGVRFANEVGGREDETGTGMAEQGEARLTALGALTSVSLKGRVAMELSGREVQRQLHAGEVELGFSGDRRPVLRTAEALHDAVLQETQRGRTEEIAGPHLVATFQKDGRGRVAPTTLTGDGGVVVQRQIGATEETSRSQSLEAQFGMVRGAGAAQKQERLGLLTVVQQGEVAVVRRAPDKEGAMQEVRARGAELLYNGTTRREILRGNAQVSEAQGTTRADELTFDEGNEQAEASGRVEVSYVGEPAGGGGEGGATVTHVSAGRAIFERTTGNAQFFAAPGGEARLWQGGSSVEGPVLVLNQKRGTLEAHGVPVGRAGVVRSVFVGRETQTGRPGRQQQPKLLRVVSSTLRYDRDARQVTFGDGVTLDAGESEVTSETAVATLQTAATTKKPQGAGGWSGFPAGGLERVVATGAVTVRQPPGRVATGAEALYTAASGEVVLTGTPGHPPRVRDPQQGDLTGGSIRLRVGDNGFVVDETGTAAKDNTRRVHTRVREPKGGR